MSPEAISRLFKRKETFKQPRMTPAESALFKSFASHAEDYLEFGSGGSTYVAAQLVSHTVTTLDSSQEWLDRVALACKEDNCRIVPTLVAVDVGETQEWGYPADEDTRERWPAYHEAIWERPGSHDCDLYMVDGRFRVACFMQILLRCRPDALIMIHDFARPEYQVINAVARPIASAEELSVFIPKIEADRAQIKKILLENRYTVV
jgi:hypothetical protein